MKFPPSSPVHQLPRFTLGGQTVRAAPIVDVWAAVDDLPSIAVVQIDSERHAIGVDAPFFKTGWPRSGTVLVVDDAGGMVWMPREAFEKQAVRFGAE